uniref:ATP dependent Clp protease n=1 Tax=Caudovirales sp. ctkvU4 TaxID=2826783 RepID=A0A8S5QPN6_9CAUD|nr:MAG TPA: Putative ATP dependent Clp protease [Caudovirales sp. ctkvU4]
MSKFWEVVNNAESENPEIRIYGNIADRKSFFGNETAPEGFAKALEEFRGKPLTVRINSSGGSVFAAHAIYNLIKSYTGNVTAIIDGLAASAATIIAVAADKIIMPSNSMMMIHDPMITLDGSLNEAELQECIDALKPIKESIVSAYLNRAKVPAEELHAMMKNTTWLTAKECLAKGFCDEIAGKVDIVMDKNFLVANQIRHPLTDEDVTQIKNKTEVKTTMNEDLKKMLEKAANALGFTITALSPGMVGDLSPAVKPQQTEPQPQNQEMQRQDPLLQNQEAQNEPPQSADAAVMAERQRILALDALSNGNATVQRIINMAKENGRTAEEVKDYIEIINKAAADTSPDKKFMKDLVNDKKNSGIEDVTGQPGAGYSEQETDAMRTERMSNMMMR